MSSALPDFQQYQLAFTAHIRNSTLHKKPAHVAEKRMAVYREAVFNNFLTTVSSCFPVCQQVVGVRAWKKLIQRFIGEHAAKTPIFREIPFEFTQFLASLENIPPYLSSLAHYEWVELEVTHQPRVQVETSPIADFIDEIPLFSPYQLLAYEYPVHQISKKNIPIAITPTYLLVYRNVGFSIQFVVLNPMTFRLLSLLSAQSQTGRQALTQLALALGQTDATSILQFGHEILIDLAQQQVFLGTTVQ